MTRDDTPTTDDETRTDTYGRRRYLQATTAAVVGTVGLAGCVGGDGGGGGGGSDDDGGSGGGGSDDIETGILSTSVTDDPGDIDDFESCVVTVTGYWLGPEPGAEDEEDDGDDGGESEATDAGTTADGTATATETPTATDTETTESTDDEEDDADDEESGRQYYELDEPAQADLVDLQDDSTQVIDDRELEASEHAYLQLDTDGVDAVLNDGSEATVEVPGEAPLKFNESFEIRADTRTSFTADFTPVQRGQTGRYNLQPVASGVEVTYEAIESDGTTGGSDGGDGTTEGGDGTTTAAEESA